MHYHLEHLYKTYDKIEETEVSLVVAKAKRRSILSDKVSGDNIYKVLVFFDKMYDIMDEAEKRDFVTQLIQKVEVYEERQPNGQWLKAIEFKLLVCCLGVKRRREKANDAYAIAVRDWRA